MKSAEAKEQPGLLASLCGECVWKWDDDTSSYDTTCDNKFQFTFDTPKENGFKFCPYCGKGIAQKKPESKKE